MRGIVICLVAVATVWNGGCRTVRDGSEPRVSEKTLRLVDPPGVSKKPPAAPEKTVEGYLPGTDKIYFVGDRKVVRAETDARPVLLPEATRRLLVGDGADGDLSLQPALLQRELAEELARTRQINEQNRTLMSQLIEASGKMVAAMEQLKKLNADLAKKLEEQVAYSKSLEEEKAAAEQEDSPGKF